MHLYNLPAREEARIKFNRGVRLWAFEASKIALKNVLEASSGEKILIICDQEKVNVREAFERGTFLL